MLPKSFLYEVLRRKLEPPWMFEIQPMRKEGGAEEEEEEEEEGKGVKPAPLKRLYATYDFHLCTHASRSACLCGREPPCCMDKRS